MGPAYAPCFFARAVMKLSERPRLSRAAGYLGNPGLGPKLCPSGDGERQKTANRCMPTRRRPRFKPKRDEQSAASCHHGCRPQACGPKHTYKDDAHRAVRTRHGLTEKGKSYKIIEKICIPCSLTRPVGLWDPNNGAGTKRRKGRQQCKSGLQRFCGAGWRSL